MKLIKAKFIKNEVPSGKAYIFASENNVVSGDYLQDAKGAKLIAVDEPVDMAFVEKYGVEKIKVIGRYVEPEKEVYDARKAYEAQEKYCSENKMPHFAPHDGRCYKCGQQIYAEGKSRIGNVSVGISVKKAGEELITGCPHCNWSYCE